MAQQLSTNTFGTAKWIVSSTLSNGTHTTIAAAITSASSGDTIFIRPGTYTENLTLKAGVNLTAFSGDNNLPTVSIVGKMTFTTAGTVTISNILLQTNSDYLLAVTGSAASIVNLMGCYLKCSNNTGILHSTSSASSQVNMYYCQGTIQTNLTTLFTSSSPGDTRIEYCTFFNDASSATASTMSGNGILFIYFSEIRFNVSISSTSGLGSFYNHFNNGNLNSTCITYTSTNAGGGNCDFCSIGSGTGSAVSVGAGATFTARNNIIVSSNVNVFTGAGTINTGGNVCMTSSGNNVSTINNLTTI